MSSQQTPVIVFTANIAANSINLLGSLEPFRNYLSHSSLVERSTNYLYDAHHAESREKRIELAKGYLKDLTENTKWLAIVLLSFVPLLPASMLQNGIHYIIVCLAMAFIAIDKRI